MYIFREISCSSSGGQIVLIQHLVSSLSISDRRAHRLRKNCSFSQPVHRTVTFSRCVCVFCVACRLCRGSCAEGVDLERKCQNPHPHTPNQHPNPWSFITFLSLQPLLYIFFSTGSAHLPIQDHSNTLYPKHRKGNIHHIYRDSTCTPPLCAPD